MTKDINVLALVKGQERYIFLFDDDNRSETLRTLGRFASNPQLSFTWYDAAVLSQKIRQISEPVAQEQPPTKRKEASTSPRFSFPLPSDSRGTDRE